MLGSIAFVLYTLILLFFSALYIVNRYHLLADGSKKKILRDNVKFILLTIFLLLCLDVIGIWFILQKDITYLPLLMRWSTLIWGCYLVAKIDYKERKIPNFLILVMLGIRCVFLIYEVCTNLEFMSNVLLIPLIGATIGGFVMIVALFLSRHGVGMGDVKLFIVIGAYVGSSKIFGTMFYTFLFSAVVGIILLATKKAKMKDSLPMAPFAFVGVVVEYILLLMGGL